MYWLICNWGDDWLGTLSMTVVTYLQMTMLCTKRSEEEEEDKDFRLMTSDLKHGIMQAVVFEDDHRGLWHPDGDTPQVQGLAGKHQLALWQQGSQPQLPRHTVPSHHLQTHACLHATSHHSGPHEFYTIHTVMPQYSGQVLAMLWSGVVAAPVPGLGQGCLFLPAYTDVVVEWLSCICWSVTSSDCTCVPKMSHYKRE